VILLSLAVFAGGSAVIATASNIDLVILGRLLQGTGAMASTMIALIGDGTRPEVRTRAMAFFGIVLGASFAAGFLAGPQVAARVGVNGVFAASCALSLLAAVVFQALVPARLVSRAAHDAAAPSARSAPTWSWPAAAAILREPPLLVLDAGIGVLHACVTGSFVVIPFLLRDHLDDRHLWVAYAPAIALGMAAMGWASHRAERADRARSVLALGGSTCVVGLVGLALLQRALVPLAASLAVFVVGFAMLEPVLAALVTRYADRASRGTAAGVFNLTQFLGVFCGGLLAGRLLSVGRWAPFVAMAALVLGWLATLRWLAAPRAPGDGAPAARPTTT
jgi:MFS family permease